ncbi:MAG: hypothetical protein R3A49_07980 [Acidimicrobiia bacterium]
MPGSSTTSPLLCGALRAGTEREVDSVDDEVVEITEIERSLRSPRQDVDLIGLECERAGTHRLPRYRALSAAPVRRTAAHVAAPGVVHVSAHSARGAMPTTIAAGGHQQRQDDGDENQPAHHETPGKRTEPPWV